MVTLTEKIQRGQRIAMRAIKAKIAARDGKRCFCCLTALPFDLLTVEHFHSVTYGGNNHMANLALLCQPCNESVGSMTIVKKIEHIIAVRSRLK